MNTKYVSLDPDDDNYIFELYPFLLIDPDDLSIVDINNYFLNEFDITREEIIDQDFLEYVESVQIADDSRFLLRDSLMAVKVWEQLIFGSTIQWTDDKEKHVNFKCQGICISESYMYWQST